MWRQLTRPWSSLRLRWFSSSVAGCATKAATATAASTASSPAEAASLPPLRQCMAYRLGLVPYAKAWDWQKQLINQRIKAQRQGDAVKFDDVALLLQHPRVYTLGRGATLANVKFDPEKEPELPLLRVDRGGEVTYHGPGQLVMYPILDLRFHKQDLHWYLRQVEEVVIQTLAAFDVQGTRIDGLTGVWVQDRRDGEMKKICAVGTHATRWITMHGFALNVSTDLKDFERIIPCGIDDREVTKLEHFDPQVTFEQVEDAAIDALAKVFGIQVTSVRAPDPFQ